MSDLALRILETPGFWDVIEPPRRVRKNTAKPLGKGSPSEKTSDSPPVSPRAARLAKLLRVVSKTPEVVVKITGKNHDVGGLRAHARYLMKKEGARAEDERGLEVAGKAAMQEAVEAWGEPAEVANYKSVPNGIHVVMSMPRATDAEAVLRAAREFAASEFANHQYFLVLHTDCDHPHVHALVNPEGFDFTRLKRKKEDLQRWREGFARALRSQGIAAEATPRQARGVVLKAKSRAMYNIERRAREGQGVKSDVLRSKIEKAANAARGLDEGGRPWEGPIAAKRSRLEQGLNEAARELASRGDEGRRAAAAVRAFISGLPPLKTEHDLLREKVAALEADHQVTPLNR